MSIFNIDEVKFLINAILNSIPYPQFKNTDENYFHTIIYLSLSLIGYNKKSELLSSRGRLDLALVFADKVFVIEFKCDKAAKTAIERIKKKNYHKEWMDKGVKTILCGINFDFVKREIREILFESK